jgi:hypothetical protein
MARTAVTALQAAHRGSPPRGLCRWISSSMQAIRVLASRPAPGLRQHTPRRGTAGRPASSTAPITEKAPSRRRQPKGSEAAARRRRVPARQTQRGANAQIIEQRLQASAPRALRPAEIREALHDKGVEISFTSLRHALDQLAKRNAAVEVGDSRRPADRIPGDHFTAK